MREIKFRAWDKKSKKMRLIDSIAFHGNGAFDNPTQEIKVVNMWGKDIIENKYIIIHRDIKDVEIMQYTGLKDKNGKEIYEGDILEETNTSSYHIGEIDYREDLACFSFNSDGIYFTFDEIDIEEKYQVIGNIYENPELITKH